MRELGGRFAVTSQPLICAQGVCRRDAELSSLWLRWTTFLAEQEGGNVRHAHLLIVMAMSVTAEQEAKLRAAVGGGRSNYFRALFVRLVDERENAYPLSASHLFLRTLEAAEKLFPGSPVLWCEPDTVAMKPSWFAEIEAEYATCGKPNMGLLVGTKFPHQAGNSIYAADWRTRFPSIAGVLEAPDVAQWGIGRGQPWDVWSRNETTPQMAESKLWQQDWKSRDVRPTMLKDIRPETCIYHQEKSGALIREIAAARYPQFMSTLRSDTKFYFMNGHPSRLSARGTKIKFTFTKYAVGGHRSAVCSDELDDNEASAIATLVGQLGISEISEAEFLRITGRTTQSLPPPRARKVTAPVAVSMPEGVTHPSVFVMLGRFGDIMNILPMLKAEADAGRRPTLVVSQEFASILDGVSYCDRIVWEGAYDRLPDALRWLRREKGITAPVVAQVHRNPRDAGRLTPSYQTEIWRLAGRLEEFATRGPLDFDRRDTGREIRLLDQNAYGNGRPLILVGLTSVSSPLSNQREIETSIATTFSETCKIVRLDQIRAERIYDLLALFDIAACLLCADTSFGHLARASKVPLVALANSGWRGSVFEHAKAVIRYENATPIAVVEAVRNALKSTWTPAMNETQKSIFDQVSEPKDTLTTMVWPRPGITPEAFAEMGEKSLRDAAPVIKAMLDRLPVTRIFHAYDPCGTEPRHLKAQESWKALYVPEGIIGRPFPRGGRDAKLTIKDPRPLPYLKDIIEAGIPADALDTDIVLWCNSDVGFAPGIGALLRQHIGQHQCAAMRRTESNGNGHPGRDLVAFTVGWWRANSATFPDYIIGAPIFDLGIVALMRRYHKLPALTMKTLDQDMHPADMTPGYALHESHDPEWQVPNTDNVPSVKWNRQLFLAWAKKFCPEIKFSTKGALQ